jgi:hypothetical protein
MPGNGPSSSGAQEDGVAAVRSSNYVPCTIKELPSELRDAAAAKAVEVNTANSPNVHNVTMAVRSMAMMPEVSPSSIASFVNKQWKKNTTLMVYFMDKPSPPLELQQRILSHMNAWNQVCSIRFVLTRSPRAEVRITLLDQGYWSYLGTDILTVPLNEATMCLQGFNMATPESEFTRVVRHETGHTLSFPHEHMREEIVAEIDVKKAIRYFAFPPNNWPESVTRHNVLTPLSYSALDATTEPDEHSIMCYSLPAEIMKDGKPVPGGLDIGSTDRDFAAHLYPFGA